MPGASKLPGSAGEGHPLKGMSLSLRYRLASSIWDGLPVSDCRIRIEWAFAFRGTVSLNQPQNDLAIALPQPRRRWAREIDRGTAVGSSRTLDAAGNEISPSIEQLIVTCLGADRRFQIRNISALLEAGHEAFRLATAAVPRV